MLKEIYRLSEYELKEAGIKTAQLDARVLICSALNISLEKFYLMQNNQLSPNQIKKIELIIKKRAQNIPVAYILGHKEFYGLDFKVNNNVLIPRPETEGLVELAIDRIKNMPAGKTGKELRIMDMGTGCGNIIISLSKNTDGQFFACDNSSSALKIARQNAKIHQVDTKIKFIKSDLFDKLKNQKFDLIIANLPYVPMSDSPSLSFQRMLESSISFEPQSAIFSADNGAEIIKRFLKDAPNYLFDHGTILLELDPRNAIVMKTYAQKYFPKNKIKLSKDLASFNRYLTIEK